MADFAAEPVSVTLDEATTRPSDVPGPVTPTVDHTRELRIDVVWGDIVHADGVCATGHYIGVAPQKAERALDVAMSGTGDERRLLLTDLTRRGAIRGELGEIAFFPLPRHRLAAIAGMGRPGRFSRPRLELLVGSLFACVGLLPDHDTLSLVLIGSGEGNGLSPRDSAETIVRKAVEVLADDPRLRVSRICLVELWLDRALEVAAYVGRIIERRWPDRRAGHLRLAAAPTLVTAAGGRIDTRFGCSMLLAALADIVGDQSRAPSVAAVFDALPEEELRERVRSELRKVRDGVTYTDVNERIRALALAFRIRQEADAASVEIPTRLGFWAEHDRIRVTAITNTVTVTERELKKRLGLVLAGVQRLQRPDPRDQPQYSADLYRLLVPRDMRELVQERTEPLVLEVDEQLAPVQWEMLQADADSRPLGLARPVTRQLRTLYSPRPADVGARARLRVLVIGDPGDPMRNLSLPDAQQEALAVWNLLTKSARVDVSKSLLLVGAPADGTLAGPLHRQHVPPADYFEVVQRLLSGAFDIVHFCGHATFVPEHPSDAGWVFKAGVLTAADLDGMVQAPSLVVANACLTSRSGLAAEDADITREGDPQLVAALADEFFHCGVGDYIGTAWEVPSAPARTFAERFYEELLCGGSIGESVRRARESLYELTDDGCAWGAYQHYGDPVRRLL